MKLTSLLFSTFLLAPLSLFNANAFSKEFISSKDINISHIYARATPPNAMNSALFATITNNSKQNRTLVSASSTVAEKVELHDVIHDGDVMKMRQVKKINILAEQTVTLKPGSLHIMLLDIKKQLKEGQEIEVIFTYANGEKQQLSVPVKKVIAGMHSHHH
jgi:copper(I)-binding protein